MGKQTTITTTENVADPVAEARREGYQQARDWSFEAQMRIDALRLAFDTRREMQDTSPELVLAAAKAYVAFAFGPDSEATK